MMSISDKTFGSFVERYGPFVPQRDCFYSILKETRIAI